MTTYRATTRTLRRQIARGTIETAWDYAIEGLDDPHTILAHEVDRFRRHVERHDLGE